MYIKEMLKMPKKHEQIEFYFCENNIKFLSDETSKVRNTLLYLTALCIMLLQFSGSNITGLLGLNLMGVLQFLLIH